MASGRLMNRKDFLSLVTSLGIAVAFPRVGGENAFADEVVQQDEGLAGEFDLPQPLERVVPSGPYSQYVLLALCPEKLVSISRGLCDESLFANTYKVISKLPVTGCLYDGGKRSVDAELVNSLDADLVIDIGDSKPGLQINLANLEALAETPTLYLDGSFGQLPKIFRNLGIVLGCESRGRELAAYCEKAISDTDKSVGCAPRILYAEGESGFSTRGPQSYQYQALQHVGALAVSRYNGDAQSVLIDIDVAKAWNPDMVLCPSRECYKHIIDCDTEAGCLWSLLPAVRKGNVVLVPHGLSSWLSSPLFVQTIGLYWLTWLISDNCDDPAILVDEAIGFYGMLFRETIGRDDAIKLITEGRRLCEPILLEECIEEDEIPSIDYVKCVRDSLVLCINQSDLTANVIERAGR